ncbi:alpha/beta fold hydrolase [Blastomonas fulva]|uniref:alpha/beta fold hydrolase n=1 Tax=Blastomonas fulva TaxID=1550728 RepID=UPI003F7187BB
MKFLGFLLAALAAHMPAYAAVPNTRSAVTAEISVAPELNLEVKDWGGAGPTLVLLAGFGGSASDFDQFALNFIDQYRVIAISRRGFGGSSQPEPSVSNYTPEQLAADVIAVLDNFEISKAFIAGHSVAGQELSEIALQHSERVAGLIYMEAANAQAFYGPRERTLYPIAGQVRRNLERLILAQPSEAAEIIKEIEEDLLRLRTGLEWYGEAVQGVEDRSSEIMNSRIMAIQNAIVLGAKVYGPNKVPTLAIFANPPQCEPRCGTKDSEKWANESKARVIDFQIANPTARVVSFPFASHFIWKSHERQTVSEIRKFIKATEARSHESK